MVLALVALLCLFAAAPVRQAWGQSKDLVVNGRKVKTAPQPTYPELARKMNISGIVKVEIVIAPNGSVKSAKAIGGHPLLMDAAVDAARRFKFEPGTEETTGVLPFEFKSTN